MVQKKKNSVKLLFQNINKKITNILDNREIECFFGYLKAKYLSEIPILKWALEDNKLLHNKKDDVTQKNTKHIAMKKTLTDVNTHAT